MKSRLIIALSFVLLICSTGNAQNVGQAKVGLTISSLGTNGVYSGDRIGTPEYSSEKLFTIGINYITPIKPWLDFETGLEYSVQTVRARYRISGTAYGSSESDLTLINVPLTLRAHFLDYLFVNAGLFLEIDASESSTIDEQTGVGALAGIGVSYDFSSNISAFLNPYIKYHSLVPLAGQNQNLMEAGIRSGIMLQLD